MRWRSYQAGSARERDRGRHRGYLLDGPALLVPVVDLPLTVHSCRGRSRTDRESDRAETEQRERESRGQSVVSSETVGEGVVRTKS